MCNIGMLDRIVRFIAGVVLISLVFTGPENLWGWLGVIPVASAFIGYCPVYTLIGYNGCRKPG